MIKKEILEQNLKFTKDGMSIFLNICYKTKTYDILSGYDGNRFTFSAGPSLEGKAVDIRKLIGLINYANEYARKALDLDKEATCDCRVNCQTCIKTDGEICKEPGCGGNYLKWECKHGRTNDKL